MTPAQRELLRTKGAPVLTFLPEPEVSRVVFIATPHRGTDVAVGFYDHTIQMQAKGKDVVAFVLLSRNSGLVMAGREDATFDPAR
ncbi:hypothetical protein ABGA94_15855, partial [Stenotrophomonas sp. 3diitr2024]